MFNLDFMNRALKEVGKGNLTTTEFTMLCLLNNDVQLNEGDVIERHNAYFMEKLNLSERQVQNLTKSLEKKGFITIKRRGTSMNSKSNVIKLKGVSEIKCEKNYEINCTPKRTRKELEKNNKINNLSIPVVSIPEGEKIFAKGIYFEDTPLIEFNQYAEDCFSQLDPFFLFEKTYDILRGLGEKAKGITMARPVVEDLVTSYGEKFEWSETFKSQLVEKIFSDADA